MKIIIKLLLVLITAISCSTSKEMGYTPISNGSLYSFTSQSDYFLSDSILDAIPCYDPNSKRLKDKHPGQLDRYIKNCVRKDCFVGNDIAIELMSKYLDFLGPHRLYYIRPQLFRGKKLYQKLMQLVSQAKCSDKNYDWSTSNNGMIALFEMIDNIDGHSPTEYCKMKESIFLHEFYREDVCSNVNYINFYVEVFTQAERENKLVLKKYNQD